MRGAGGGPKTLAGKARSSRNSIRHGILSDAAAIPGFEDPRDWERHRDGIFESLHPEGQLERNLAELAAWSLWKLFRTANYQAMVTQDWRSHAESDLRISAAYREGTISEGEFPEVDPADVEALQRLRILPGEGELLKIQRYEAHLHRQYIQTLHELEAIQARRRGEHTPLARLDITGSPP
jgi:hypothetical protein